VAKNRFINQNEEDIYFDLDDPIAIAKYMESRRSKKNKFLFLDDEENEKTDYVQYEYI
jgi:hypothetical protein